MALLPVVEEFVSEVAGRDAAAVEACLVFTEPRVLAVLCAELLASEQRRVGELRRVEAAYVTTRQELVEARARVAELREMFYEREAA